MKRYLVFAYDAFYPVGGEGDYVGEFFSLTEAFAAAKATNRDDFDILDIHTGEWNPSLTGEK